MFQKKSLNIDKHICNNINICQKYRVKILIEDLFRFFSILFDNLELHLINHRKKVIQT